VGGERDAKFGCGFVPAPQDFSTKRFNHHQPTLLRLHSKTTTKAYVWVFYAGCKI